MGRTPAWNPSTTDSARLPTDKLGVALAHCRCSARNLLGTRKRRWNTWVGSTDNPHPPGIPDTFHCQSRIRWHTGCSPRRCSDTAGAALRCCSGSCRSGKHIVPRQYTAVCHRSSFRASKYRRPSKSAWRRNPCWERTGRGYCWDCTVGRSPPHTRGSNRRSLGRSIDRCCRRLPVHSSRWCSAARPFPRGTQRTVHLGRCPPNSGRWSRPSFR